MLWACASAISLAFVSFDYVDRWQVVRTFHGLELLTYCASVAILTAFFRYCLEIWSVRRTRLNAVGAILIAFAFVLAIIQRDFVTRYGVAFDPAFASANVTGIPTQRGFEQRMFDAVGFLVIFTIAAFAVLVVARLLVFTTPRHLASSMRRGALIGLLFPVLVGVVFDRVSSRAPPFYAQAMHPVPLYLASLGADLAGGYWLIAREYPDARKPEPVPSIRSTAKGSPPNVVLIVGESIRAVDFGRDEATWPGARRFVFDEMRSLASSTAVSTGVLFTGLPTTTSRARANAAPLVFDFAKSAGFHTALYSAQTLLFGNNGRWLDGAAIDRFVSATSFDPRVDSRVGSDDGLALDLAVRELMGFTREPFFGVVHLSNTHFPYKVSADETDLPTGIVQGDVVRSRYERSVRLERENVAAFMRRLRASAKGRHTIVLFISDHGEQFYEHGSFSHTRSLHEEEIRVPAWLDVPDGLLTTDAVKALEQATTSPTTHADVLPTLFDLLAMDERDVSTYRTQMPGRSLLRAPPESSPPIALTNCTASYYCEHPSFAVLHGRRKLVAPAVPPGEQRGKDGRVLVPTTYECFDLDKDPQEKEPLLGGCKDLEPTLLDLEKAAKVAQRAR